MDTKQIKLDLSLVLDLNIIEDFNLGFSTRSFYEKIDTDTTASARQQSQEGNYLGYFFKFTF